MWNKNRWLMAALACWVVVLVGAVAPFWVNAIWGISAEVGWACFATELALITLACGLSAGADSAGSGGK